MRRLELLDTSILLELLRVPYESDRYEGTARGFEERHEEGTELQLPVAAVVEAGGHVSRVRDGDHRRECANRLSAMIDSTLRRSAPWSFSPLEWDEQLLGELVAPTDERAPAFVDSLTRKFLEMGDMLIVAEFRRVRDNLNRDIVDVDVWTYDANLRGVVDALRA